MVGTDRVKVGAYALAGCVVTALVTACSGAVDVPAPPSVDSNAVEPAPGEAPAPAAPRPAEVTGGGDLTPSPPAETIATSCRRLAASACARLKQCAPGLYPAVWEGDTHCVQVHADRCEAIATSPGSSLRGGADACRLAIESAACGDLVSDALSACASPGALPVGSPCGHASQCASAFCPLAGLACGACATRVSAGDACVSGACPSPLACAAGRCVAPAARGSACSAAAPCGPEDTCAGGVCAPYGTLGAACEVGGLPACDAATGLFCDPVSNVCRSLALAKAGEACGVSVSGRVTTATACGGAGECVGATLSHMGACAPKRRAGEACGAGTTGCAPGLACVGGACTPPDPSACR